MGSGSGQGRSPVILGTKSLLLEIMVHFGHFLVQRFTLAYYAPKFYSSHQ